MMQFVLQNSSPKFFFEKKKFPKRLKKKQKKRDPNKFFIKQKLCLDSLAEKDIADNLALTLNQHSIIPRQ